MILPATYSNVTLVVVGNTAYLFSRQYSLIQLYTEVSERGVLVGIGLDSTETLVLSHFTNYLNCLRTYLGKKCYTYLSL